MIGKLIIAGDKREKKKKRERKIMLSSSGGSELPPTSCRLKRHSKLKGKKKKIRVKKKGSEIRQGSWALYCSGTR